MSGINMAEVRLIGQDNGRCFRGWDVFKIESGFLIFTWPDETTEAVAAKAVAEFQTWQEPT